MGIAPCRRPEPLLRVTSTSKVRRQLRGPRIAGGSPSGEAFHLMRHLTPVHLPAPWSSSP